MKINLLNDSHTHVSMDVSLKETIVSFKRVNERTNVVRINFLALNGHITYAETQLDNSKCLYLKSKFAPYGYAGYNIDHSKKTDAQGILEQVKLAQEAGFDCWKIIEGKPNSQCVWKQRIDSDDYELAFKYAEETQFPIIIHVADPSVYFNTDYSDKSIFLSKKEYQDEIINVLERHPNLLITIAHMGFMGDNPLYVEELLNKYPNLHFDNVPGPEEYFEMSKHQPEWKRIHNEYSTRFLFGTDRGNHGLEGKTVEEWFKCYPETASYQRRFYENDGLCDGRHPFPGLEEYWGTEWNALGITDEAYNNIFYDNFIRIYEDPRPINYKILKELAEYEFALPSKSKYLKEDLQDILIECEKHIK